MLSAEIVYLGIVGDRGPGDLVVIGVMLAFSFGFIRQPGAVTCTRPSVKRRTKNEPRFAMPSCHGRR